MTQGNLIKKPEQAGGKKLALQQSRTAQKPHYPIPLQLLWPKNCQDCHARRNKPTTYYINGESALMAEADEESRITRAYGFNPNTQQARTNEEGEDAGEGLWSTAPIWQAELNSKTSLKEASSQIT